ncbi:hypothetical protein RvY_15420 [Ramazzottius varieornatus]|uniref:U2A'/phosphoprotein 32 family A C-terminal domain-containing protein n=1 Tax=Ramazzottius varieornatus TaxID=947166 RepID=A0A1D1VUV6_RAMVA|nr:hypothetical protein RvY_15420 [Ramazzottius varieornatus]
MFKNPNSGTDVLLKRTSVGAWQAKTCKIKMVKVRGSWMNMGKITDLKTLILTADKERPAATVKKLTLDGAKAEDLSAVTELLESHIGLQSLSLVAVGLTSLHGLPQLPTLRKLYVGDNKLSGSLDVVAVQCPNLEELSLVGNQRIKTMEVLAPLKALGKLKVLDVIDCGLVQKDPENYRKGLREYFPQLEIVDGMDGNDQEVMMDDGDSEDEELDSDHEEEDYTDTDGEDNDENDRFIDVDTYQSEGEMEDESAGSAAMSEQPAANGRKTLNERTENKK